MRTYHRHADRDAFDCDPAPDLADFDRLLVCHRAMRQAEQSFACILASLAQEDDGGRRDEAEETVTTPPRCLVMPLIRGRQMKRSDPITQNEIDYCDHVRFVLTDDDDDPTGWPVEEINRTAREAYARRLNVWYCVKALRLEAAEQRDAA